MQQRVRGGSRLAALCCASWNRFQLLASLVIVVACEGADPATLKSASELTSTDGSTGVAECDSYLDQFEQCMQLTLPSHQFNQQQAGIRRQRAAWKSLADSPGKKQSLALVCRQAIITAREELGACAWQGGQCGNGVVNAGEGCDDGNTNGGDGCSATCAVEPVCGNGVKEGTEQCDDGNLTNGDGCSAACASEPKCTDGLKNGTETDVDCGGTCAADCAAGKACSVNADCANNNCVSGVCALAAVCPEASAIDLGAPGASTLVARNACVRVKNGYPSWWGTSRGMQLQSQQGGTYPVPYTWSSACAGSSGSGSFTADWQSKLLTPTNSQCATLIKLGGVGTGNVRLTYQGQ